MHPFERPDTLDRAGRRRAAEAEARAAEARAAVAAAEARAAIAAAARAAAAADAAAEAAEAAAARVADEFGPPSLFAEPPPVEPSAVDATQPVPARTPPVGSAPRGPDPAPGEQGDPDSTALLPAVPPAPPAVGADRTARHRVAGDTGPHTPVEGGDAPPEEGGPVPAPADAPGAVAGDGPPDGVDATDDADREGVPARASRRTRASGAGRGSTVLRHARRPLVLVAAAVVAVLVLGGIALGTGVFRGAPPVPAVDPTASGGESADLAAPEAGAPAAAAADPAAAPLSNRGAEFLAQLRAAGVPTTRAGTAEVEAADLVCAELAGGTEVETLARALPASLTTVSRSQAAQLIGVAREHYC